jgi:hypothetical protein
MLASVTLAAACAHEGSALKGNVYSKGDVRVELGPIPPEWRKVQIDRGDLAFRDDPKEGSALFNVRCGQRDDDAPLQALTEHLIMGTTERQYEAQNVVPFDSREALHTVLRAKLDGVPMQYDLYVMKKDGCVVDLVYVAPPERFADGSADFERFARGVHLLSDSLSASASTAASSDP